MCCQRNVCSRTILFGAKWQLQLIESHHLKDKIDPQHLSWRRVWGQGSVANPEGARSNEWSREIF